MNVLYEEPEYSIVLRPFSVLPLSIGCALTNHANYYV